jgi:hypothetical protein
VKVATVAAAPHYGLFSAKDSLGFDVRSEIIVSFLVLFLGHRHCFQNGRNFLEAFFSRGLCEGRIKGTPLMVFAARSSLQVVNSRAYDAGRERSRYFDIAAFEEFEETFGMLLLLIGCFFENVAYLDESLFPCRAGKVSISISGLGLTGKSAE